ncbi:tetratricopeptide repeat protein [Streptomyces sp. NPDC002917]|uniref:tetratricopeptide repeat protein n=1 Tax=unclassified Streptomyces TaxID=2593676 RepID=UPI002E8101A1|nr:hypothetical protein [Streptomyces sp. NBC_00562]WUC23206.1 hypothetical protein OHA33_32515 [Streptomyces sp. NBC_00562]
MDAADLDHRHRTYDSWIPPTVAALLHEHGHHGILRDAAASGDWFCAHRLAEAAVDHAPGGQAAALALLEPFVGTGWWPAVSTVAGLLAEWEMIDEAIALLRPVADTGHRKAVRELARLLAGQGHIDQVVAVLGPRSADQSLASELVELTVGCGRDAEIAALLPAVGVGATDPFESRVTDTWDTVPLHAALLERQGRIDEAAALLGRHVHVDGVMYADHAEQLARLLARHGRETELRAFTVEGGEEYALSALTEFLEERGRIPEAVALLQEPAGTGNPHAAFHLAELLARHGRHDEAVEVLRPVAESAGGDSDWIIHLLCRIIVDAGRADDALAYVDDYFARHGGSRHEQALARAYVLKRCGRAAEADAELAPFARLDEDLLHDGTVRGAIAFAERLVRQGEPQKAIAHLRDRLDGAKVLQRENLR